MEIESSSASSVSHRFKDEWLVRAALRLPQATKGRIDLFRKQNNIYLSQALLQAEICTPDQLGRAVRNEFNVPFLFPTHRDVDKRVLSLIPEKVCQTHRMFPLRFHDDSLEIVMANPLDIDALRHAQEVSGRHVSVAFALPETIELLIAEFYSADTVIADLLHNLDVTEDLQYLGADSDQEPVNKTEFVDAPVVKLVDRLIVKAIQLGASDIHIEHSDIRSDVRYRIDGLLRKIMTLPRSLAMGPMVSRIKIMANLDVADRNRPQDGRAKLRVKGKDIGLRVSTLPTNHGEKVVMRILDPKSAEKSFDQMGFSPKIQEGLERAMKTAQGIVLVTGPTGSGKTTTLYSMINKLKSEDTNIVTVEDPIEYRLPGVNQVQVNPKAGLDFATVLRSVLRQDPDTILVGEMRDSETASVAFQAAMTGHLVFSTLHTNDTISGVRRLADMGVERFKIAPALVAVTAQRLVRRLCQHCRKAVDDRDADPTVTALLKQHHLPLIYYQSSGCAQCNDIGYKGRVSIVEFLDVTRRLRELIGAGSDEALLLKTALKEKTLRTMESDALWHLSQGQTSVSEVLPYLSLHLKKEKPEAVDKIEARRSQPTPFSFQEIDLSTTQTPDLDLDIKSGKAENALPSTERNLTIESPANNEANIPPAPITPPKKSMRVPGKEKILLADDNNAMRMLMKMILEKRGFIVEEAENGEMALEKAASGRPDLIILDINMPRLNGRDVLQRLQQAPSCPIIILTSNSDEAIHEEMLNMGADDFIVKPFKPNLLLSRIKTVLRHAEKQ